MPVELPYLFVMAWAWISTLLRGRVNPSFMCKPPFQLLLARLVFPIPNPLCHYASGISISLKCLRLSV